MITLFSDLSLSSYGIVTHDGVEISNYSRVSLLISTTGSCNVYVQFSDDNDNWYDWYDLNDEVITFTVNNVKKAYEIDLFTKYIRIVIYNSTATSVTVSCSLMGQV